MTTDEHDTDPTGLELTPTDILSYLMGAVQRLECLAASEEPPPWASKLFARITNLELGCKERHSNGAKPTSLW